MGKDFRHTRKLLARGGISCLTVNAVNDAPVAVDDIYSIPEDTTLLAADSVTCGIDCPGTLGARVSPSRHWLQPPPPSTDAGLSGFESQEAGTSKVKDDAGSKDKRERCEKDGECLS